MPIMKAGEGIPKDNVLVPTAGLHELQSSPKDSAPSLFPPSPHFLSPRKSKECKVSQMDLGTAPLESWRAIHGWDIREKSPPFVRGL